MQLPNLSSFFSGLNLGTNQFAPSGTASVVPQAPANPSGKTDPAKVAASTAVANPNTPLAPGQTTTQGNQASHQPVQRNGSTAAQSSVIANGSNSGSLTSQLYNGQGGVNSNPSVSTTPTTPTNPAITGNALLDDPELSSINSKISSVADQEAQVQGAQNEFVTDQYGDALASPISGDFLDNQTGPGSFNSMKTAQEEGNLGLAMTADQAAFANREGQIKDAFTQTPVSPGGINVNPYTSEPVASAPSVVGFGQGVYTPPVVTPENPTGGSGAASSGSTISPTDPFYPTLQSYAQMAANGQMSSIPTSITGNSVLNAQLNEMAKAINPNYNPVVSSAESAATASNVETTGTATTNAANTGYTAANQEYNNNVASYTALTGISNQVTSTLENYANSGSLTDMNAAINTLQGHLSNPDYQKFITAIGNAQASYQSILGSSGVTPTKADQDALSALNPNSSASTIVAALNQLSSDAHALIIAPTYQKVQTYKQQLGIQ
jgi:hypothetical protein